MTEFDPGTDDDAEVVNLSGEVVLTGHKLQPRTFKRPTIAVWQRPRPTNHEFRRGDNTTYSVASEAGTLTITCGSVSVEIPPTAVAWFAEAVAAAAVWEDGEA